MLVIILIKLLCWPVSSPQSPSPGSPDWLKLVAPETMKESVCPLPHVPLIGGARLNSLKSSRIWQTGHFIIRAFLCSVNIQ